MALAPMPMTAEQPERLVEPLPTPIVPSMLPPPRPVQNKKSTCSASQQSTRCWPRSAKAPRTLLLHPASASRSRGEVFGVAGGRREIVQTAAPGRRARPDVPGRKTCTRKRETVPQATVIDMHMLVGPHPWFVLWLGRSAAPRCARAVITVLPLPLTAPGNVHTHVHACQPIFTLVRRGSVFRGHHSHPVWQSVTGNCACKRERAGDTGRILLNCGADNPWTRSHW